MKKEQRKQKEHHVTVCDDHLFSICAKVTSGQHRECQIAKTLHTVNEGWCV
jgi:hypothetical protein